MTISINTLSFSVMWVRTLYLFILRRLDNEEETDKANHQNFFTCWNSCFPVFRTLDIGLGMDKTNA